MSQVTKKGRKPTTIIEHSQEFLMAANANPEGALAFKYMEAFGMTLETAIIIVRRMLASKDASVFMIMLVAGVQVRKNVTFVGNDFAGIRTKYPELIIKGRKDTDDLYNFGALHICGHIIGHTTKEQVISQLLGKAGDCVAGKEFPDNEAGDINKEIRSTWTDQQSKDAVTKAEALGTEHDVFVKYMVVQIPALYKAFMDIIYPIT